MHKSFDKLNYSSIKMFQVIFQIFSFHCLHDNHKILTLKPSTNMRLKSVTQFWDFGDRVLLCWKYATVHSLRGSLDMNVECSSLKVLKNRYFFNFKIFFEDHQFLFIKCSGTLKTWFIDLFWLQLATLQTLPLIN